MRIIRNFPRYFVIVWGLLSVVVSVSFLVSGGVLPVVVSVSFLVSGGLLPVVVSVSFLVSGLSTSCIDVRIHFLIKKK